MPYFDNSMMRVPCPGAFSTLSSTLNSMAACTWKDMLESRFKLTSEENKSRILKLLGKVKQMWYYLTETLLYGTFPQI